MTIKYKSFFSTSFILGVLFFVAPQSALAHFNEGKVHVHTEAPLLLSLLFVIGFILLVAILYISGVFTKDYFRKDK